MSIFLLTVVHTLILGTYDTTQSLSLPSMEVIDKPAVLKFLTVDDMSHILPGLRECFDIKEYGVEVCGVVLHSRRWIGDSWWVGVTLE